VVITDSQPARKMITGIRTNTDLSFITFSSFEPCDSNPGVDRHLLRHITLSVT
jgi:hypothetical protein